MICNYNYNSGKEKNQTEKEGMRFYGPATSCEELLKIGYTRNGFYLVKGKNATSNSHVEMVDCLFANPNGVKEGKNKYENYSIEINLNLNQLFFTVGNNSQGETTWIPSFENQFKKILST